MAQDGAHEGQQCWRAVRRGLNEHRMALSEVAAQLHRTAIRVDGTTLLTCQEWLPAAPVELSAIALRWVDAPEPPRLSGNERQTKAVRPTDRDGRPYRRYSQAIRDLDPPTLFENRVSYRLQDIAWNAAGTGAFAFGPPRTSRLWTCARLLHTRWPPHISSSRLQAPL